VKDAGDQRLVGESFCERDGLQSGEVFGGESDVDPLIFDDGTTRCGSCFPEFYLVVYWG
jgi:hypothetical protein